ncbi:hypothetical protein CI088_09145 [Enterococcus plantarum]|uniref:Uncharacterized protein n=1 Tax=Enterococcus plantarum TaxID=1077675 RepID=A0A2W4BKL7_9ENTE|nr:hypothetical protein [Enterococcus plantarum]PZL73029.1 hypothetical protein CI088_09145 [Enterococcus plantarum]
MAFDIRGFANALNESKLVVDEGRVVIITRLGEREEYNLDSEVIGNDGFLAKTLEFKSEGRQVKKDIYHIKSVNGIVKDKFK